MCGNRRLAVFSDSIAGREAANSGPLRSRASSLRPMHGNRRYVKLAWIGLLVGLTGFLPARAESEIVASTGAHGFLATAPDGSPRVGYIIGGEVVVARRAGGRWSSRHAGRVPTGESFVAGLVVDRGGRSSILVQAENGSWLA